MKRFANEEREGPMTEITATFDSRSISFGEEGDLNRLYLRMQQIYANDILRARGHIFLNEIYDLLGLPRTRLGQIEGWWWVPTEEYDQVDFGCWHTEEDGPVELKFNTNGNILDSLET